MEQKISTNTFTPSATNLMSDDVRDLLKSIRAAKREFGPLMQSGKNQHQKYEYAKIDDILDAVEEPLLNHDVLIMHQEEVVDGQERLVTTLIHLLSGQWTKDVRTVINEKGGNQGRGAGQTYARKDALRALLSLRAKDDDCEEENQFIQSKSNGNTNAINDKQLALLHRVLRETTQDQAEQKLIAKYGALNQIPWNKFNEILAWLKPQDNP